MHTGVHVDLGQVLVDPPSSDVSRMSSPLHTEQHVLHACAQHVYPFPHETPAAGGHCDAVPLAHAAGLSCSSSEITAPQLWYANDCVHEEHVLEHEYRAAISAESTVHCAGLNDAW